MQSAETAITLASISKSYRLYKRNSDRIKETFHPFRKQYHKPFLALEDVSFSIEKGESVGIIGRNGSGKSTLLQILCGVLQPTSGELQVNGRISALLELGAGFNPEFTGRENVYLNAAILGFTAKETDERFPRIADFADIGEFIDRPVKTYSSGMYVRLAFATAISVEPEILIIDEALAVGDIFFQQKCIQHMKKVMQASTILLVSHDMHTITNMCNRVIVLDEGRVVFSGQPSEGVSKYTKLVHSTIERDRKRLSVHQALPEKVVAGVKRVVADFDAWISIDEEDIGGVREIKIVRASVTKDGIGLTTVKKGESITVRMIVQSIKEKDSIIFGYTIKDRVGNAIFGENSLCLDNAVFSLAEGYSLVSYHFVWPEVYPETYTLTLGIGEGTDPLVHLVQCWAHNIVSFAAITPGVSVHGMFNNPLEKVAISPLKTDSPA